MSKQDVQKLVEEHLDSYIYGGPKYEMEHIDYASGLFRQAEDLDALILLSMMHSRRANISLIMHLMSRAAELYLKSCLARHYIKEGLTHEQMLKELRKSSSGFYYKRAKPKQSNSQSIFQFFNLPPRNSHSLSQLWQTCWNVLGQKYNLKENHNWNWTQDFCLNNITEGGKDDWYELIYEPNEKEAWSRSEEKALRNNEVGYIKDFAEDFLKNILPI